jgi:hypothetical protein
MRMPANSTKCQRRFEDYPDSGEGRITPLHAAMDRHRARGIVLGAGCQRSAKAWRAAPWWCARFRRRRRWPHLAASSQREVGGSYKKPAEAVPIGGKWSRRPATDGTRRGREHCQRASEVEVKLRGNRWTGPVKESSSLLIWLRRAPDVADEKAPPERSPCPSSRCLIVVRTMPFDL